MSLGFIVLGSAALLSLWINVWQWLASRAFPLHTQSGEVFGSPPSLTLLKPLKGCDLYTEECLRSWLDQRYDGRWQLRFGVYDPADPVVALVERLIREYPTVDARLVICQPLLGANAKVSTLTHLQKEMQGDIVIVSDADVVVDSGFLTSVVQPLKSSRVGLVNCFYMLGKCSSAAMRWEAVAINSDFWSQVLQGQTLKPLDFALGAVMAVRRSALEEMGGFTVLLNHLADDYQLGHQIAAQGLEIRLSPQVVECRGATMIWSDVWNHQLRWARTIRVCQPVPWFFSILSNVTLWPICFAMLCPGPFSGLVLLTCLGARRFFAHDQQLRLTRSADHTRWLWLVPVKDLLHTALWAMSFFGNRVHWRGRDYRVNTGGLLTPL